MRVLSVAFPLMPVSADAGGGAEQILWHLDRGIVAAGHRSIVIAARGSSIGGHLVPTSIANGDITDEVRHRAHQEHRIAIDRVVMTQSIDLIHFHGLDFPAYLPDGGPPMLATLHLPVDWYPPEIYRNPSLTISLVSNTQASNAPPCPIVLNGIDLTRFRPDPPKRDFALVLSRICPEKGIDAALRMAHQVDSHLIIAGPVHPFVAHQRYFKNQVEPLLDDWRIYLGPVGGQQKAELLTKAKCVLVPSSVAETSSLVAMEAIACGTPVIAFRSGALPEVVDHGVTGFVVDSEDEMADAVRHLNSISSDQCRRIAEERFDADRMIRDYLELYRAIASSSSRQRGMAVAPQSVL